MANANSTPVATPIGTHAQSTADTTSQVGRPVTAYSR